MISIKSIIYKREFPFRGDSVSILKKHVQFEAKSTNISIEDNLISEIRGEENILMNTERQTCFSLDEPRMVVE